MKLSDALPKEKKDKPKPGDQIPTDGGKPVDKSVDGEDEPDNLDLDELGDDPGEDELDLSLAGDLGGSIGGLGLDAMDAMGGGMDGMDAEGCGMPMEADPLAIDLNLGNGMGQPKMKIDLGHDHDDDPLNDEDVAIVSSDEELDDVLPKLAKPMKMKR